jgi:proteasome lid subunit RPN8/RPN11
LRLSRARLDEILQHVAAGGGLEVSGILAGKRERVERVFPIRNAHADPERRYQMDPREQLHAYRAIEDAGMDVVAYYHSHPDFAKGELSATDLAQATEGDYALYALVHRGALRAFAVERGVAREVPVEVSERA